MNSPVLSCLLWVRGLRAFADGYVSLLLPLYLTALGMSPFQVGVIATGTLLGSGLLTLLAGVHAWRFQYRTLLLAAALLMAATGFGFAAVTEFWPLLVIAVVGMLNPSSGDVSVFLPLEHAVMSRAVEDRRRTVCDGDLLRDHRVHEDGCVLGDVATGQHDFCGTVGGRLG